MSKTNKHTNKYNSIDGVIDQTINHNTTKTINKNNNYIKSLEDALQVAREIGRKENQKWIATKTAIKLSVDTMFKVKVLQKFMEQNNITQEELSHICPQIKLFQDDEFNERNSSRSDRNDNEEGEEGEGKEEEDVNIENNASGFIIKTSDEDNDDSNMFTQRFIEKVTNGFNEALNKNELDSEKISEEMFMNEFQKNVLKEVGRMSNFQSGISEKTNGENHTSKDVGEINHPMIYILTPEQARKWLRTQFIVLSTLTRDIMTGTCKYNYDQLYYDENIQNKFRENNLIICDEEDVGKDLKIVLNKYENKIKSINERQYQARLNSSYPSSGNSNSRSSSHSVYPVFYTYCNTNDIRKSNCYSNTTFKTSKIC
jgi:hypothetical protein